MFDLPVAQVPSDLPALQEAIEASVRRRVKAPDRRAVTLTTMTLDIELTGATVEIEPADTSNLQPPKLVGEPLETTSVAELSVVGQPLTLQTPDGVSVPVSLEVRGANVHFAIGKSERPGELAMVPTRGEFSVLASVLESDLMPMVRSQAEVAAAEKGVKLKTFEVDVDCPSPRAVELSGRVAGEKKIAFFNAPFEINFDAAVTIEPAEHGLQGRFTKLDVHGESTVVSAILALVKPKIEAIKAEPIDINQLLAVAGVQGLEVGDVGVEVTGEGATRRVSMRADLHGRATA